MEVAEYSISLPEDDFDNVLKHFSRSSRTVISQLSLTLMRDRFVILY